MRLGSYPCKLIKDSLAAEVYQELEIDERHRHRFEVNNDYRQVMQDKGLHFSGHLQMVRSRRLSSCRSIHGSLGASFIPSLSHVHTHPIHYSGHLLRPR